MAIPFKGMLIGLVGLGLGWGGCSLSQILSNRSPTIGETSIQYTSDNQWRFLYHLSTKVFNYLKNDKTAKLNHSYIQAKNKTRSIDWLALKFNLSKDYSLATNNWRTFKDICTEQLKKENQVSMFAVMYLESRLCFIADYNWQPQAEDEYKGLKLLSQVRLQLSSAALKGSLWKWKDDYIGDKAPYNLTAFKQDNWQKSNYQLWLEFEKSKRTEISNPDLVDKDFQNAFESWYKSDEAYSSGSINTIGKKMKLKDALTPVLTH